MPDLAKKALYLLVLGKLFTGYRQQIYSLLIISNPFSLIVKNLLETVVKDVGRLLPALKDLIIDRYELTPGQFRSRLIVVFNLVIFVAFMWKLLKHINSNLEGKKTDEKTTVKSTGIRRSNSAAINIGQWRAFDIPMNTSTTSLRYSPQTAHERNALFPPVIKKKKVFKNNLVHKAKSLLELNKLN